MSYATIQAQTTQGVCTLTLNRPEVRNAMSLAMVSELLTALQAAEQDPSVRAIVVRGQGGHFCAGGDISDMAQARMKLAQMQAMPDQVEGMNPVAETNAAFGRLCLAYAHSPLPIVTVLEGTVMGGGFGLACVSDVSLALDTVSFRLPETSLGIIPAQIAPFLVERLGYAEAKRLAVTGAKVNAAEALTLRLVHEVHANTDELEGALQRTLAGILACGPQAIATTKGLLARARLTPPDQLVDDAARLFAQAVLSDEGQEGTGAFMQKRKPKWVPQQG
ncbi:MAG: enoyl-CoA hydratase/isomerase family protein [Burkholderiales bacterium]|nr:enoyl-CoA hydratase/isomerase family protein [Burkholderiales bacterium]MBH2016025.1 enoyl-CoA hydratase/isomerase family protein [Burkholderiales bacterium]